MKQETMDRIIETIALAGIGIAVWAVPILAIFTGQVFDQMPEGLKLPFIISIVTLCYLEIIHCMRFMGFDIGNMGIGKPVKGA